MMKKALTRKKALSRVTSLLLTFIPFSLFFSIREIFLSRKFRNFSIPFGSFNSASNRKISLALVPFDSTIQPSVLEYPTFGACRQYFRKKSFGKKTEQPWVALLIFSAVQLAQSFGSGADIRKGTACVLDQADYSFHEMADHVAAGIFFTGGV